MVRRRRYPNSILQSLPSSELASISPELRDIDLSKGTLLFEPDTPSTNVYFPINSVISFIGDTGEGGSLEVWAVGSEGLAGVSGILGRTKPFRGVVQVSGNALVAKAAVFRRNFQRCSAFHDAIIQQNNIPIALIRARLLGEKLTRDYKPQWRFYERG